MAITTFLRQQNQIYIQNLLPLKIISQSWSFSQNRCCYYCFYHKHNLKHLQWRNWFLVNLQRWAVRVRNTRLLRFGCLQNRPGYYVIAYYMVFVAFLDFILKCCIFDIYSGFTGFSDFSCITRFLVEKSESNVYFLFFYGFSGYAENPENQKSLIWIF